MKLAADPHPVWHDECHEFYIRIQVGGTRKRLWLGTQEDAAKRKAKALLRKMARGKLVLPQSGSTQRTSADGQLDVRIEELSHRYLTCVMETLAPTTFDARRRILRVFIQWIGPCMVSSITRLKLEEYYAWARRTHPRSPNGGNEHLRHVKTMLRWGEETGLCTCPVRKFPKISYQQPDTKRVSLEDLRAFMEVAPADVRDIVTFGLLTGLRPQEICALERRHVRTDSEGKLYLQIEKHKTSRTARNPTPRSVPLSADADEIVRRQMANHPFGQSVFVNADGGPYAARVLHRRIDRWCEVAGVPVFCPYALRHTFASLQAEAGVNVLALAGLMGHTTPRTTARYVSNSDDFNRGAMDAVAARVRGAIPFPLTEQPVTESGQKVARSLRAKKDLQDRGGKTTVVAES